MCFVSIKRDLFSGDISCNPYMSLEQLPRTSFSAFIKNICNDYRSKFHRAMFVTNEPTSKASVQTVIKEFHNSLYFEISRIISD